MLKLFVDEQARILRADIKDVLTVAEAEKFKADLTIASADARRRFGRFILIADTLGAPVQPQEVIMALPTPMALVKAPEDRWAVVVSSTLARMQAERLLANPQAKAFLTVAEAEQWALA